MNPVDVTDLGNIIMTLNDPSSGFDISSSVVKSTFQGFLPASIHVLNLSLVNLIREEFSKALMCYVVLENFSNLIY